jgi:hypothetical protein
VVAWEFLSGRYPKKTPARKRMLIKRKNPYLLSALFICFANKQGSFSPLSVTQFQTGAYPNPQENQKSKKRNLLRLKTVLLRFFPSRLFIPQNSLSFVILLGDI